jgi:hypothetical protein
MVGVFAGVPMVRAEERSTPKRAATTTRLVEGPIKIRISFFRPA